MCGQRSIESDLNPTDFYYAVRTERAKGIHGGVSLVPSRIWLDLAFVLESGPLGANLAGKKGKQMKYRFFANENIRHFSFYSGMHYGLHTWKLYRMDYKSPENVKWGFVKQYAFCQGQILENLPEWNM
ncbi:MAG: hypothetical protein QME12_02960 [Nanoarchaeota archaeon]|nr:hypothetical protein [Nanoarchaeota archaeon]